MQNNARDPRKSHPLQHHRAEQAWRDNVFVERLWRTIKYEKVYLRAYDSVSDARESLRRYLKFYNGKGPHSSPDGQTPNHAYLKNSATNPGRGLTEREIHLRNRAKLFKGNDPPLYNVLFGTPLPHLVSFAVKRTIGSVLRFVPHELKGALTFGNGVTLPKIWFDGHDAGKEWLARISGIRQSHDRKMIDDAQRDACKYLPNVPNAPGAQGNEPS